MKLTFATMNQTPYMKEDFEECIADPAEENAEADLFGRKCMPVGINDTFMPTDKFAKDNLDKAQYNIRDRFGHLSEDDDDNESIQEGDN